MLKFMVIDTTASDRMRFLAIAGAHGADLLAQLNNAKGVRAVALPLEGRSFSKFEVEPLQYLFWNTFQETPPDDFANLLQRLRTHAEAMPLDQTPLSTIEAELLAINPAATISRQVSNAVRATPRAPAVAGERPKGTTTGKVWDIADDFYTDGADFKVIRPKIMAACTAAGINEATAATQYSKWKAAKVAAVPK